jgi:hypothetical protein
MMLLAGVLESCVRIYSRDDLLCCQDVHSGEGDYASDADQDIHVPAGQSTRTYPRDGHLPQVSSIFSSKNEHV